MLKYAEFCGTITTYYKFNKRGLHMDFDDKVKDFSNHLKNIQDKVSNEESTKNSMVLPFFQILGYDVFDPAEFVPEFTADTGTKRGERVDYAIIRGKEPVAIIEVKPVHTDLNSKHINQLFRYFSVTKVRFAILTDGIIYKFYSDLENPNIMDLDPFMEVDMLNLSDSVISELKKFSKNAFKPKDILSNASQMKYSSLLRRAISEQFENPSDTFIRALIKDIYTKSKTQSVIDQFRPLVSNAFKNYINDCISERLHGAMKTKESDIPTEPETFFTAEELEILNYVKNLLPNDNFIFKKTTRYAYMYIGNQNKWICRVIMQKKNRMIVLHKLPGATYETDYIFDDVELLGALKEVLRFVYEKCKSM